MSTVIAVVGTIAGAGTTTVATSLGTALGEQRRRVALVDATEEGSRIEDSIDVTGDGELVDALRRGTTPADVQASGPHDVAAFPADPATTWGAIRPDAIDTFYETLRERFEFTVVDCGCSMSAARSPWLGHADEVAIVTDPDVAGAVAEPAALASAFDVPIRGVLANRVPHKEVDDALDAMETVDVPVLGVLPEDPTVGAAAKAGTSVLRAEPDSPIATCVWKLALRIRETDHDEPVVPPGTGARVSQATEQEREGTATGETNADGSTAEDAATGTTEATATPMGAAGDTTANAIDDTAHGNGDADDAEATAVGSRSAEDGDADADDQPDAETTDPPSPAEAGFETAEPQPVDPAPNATAVEPTAEAGEGAGGATDRSANRAASDEADPDERDVAEPERAAASESSQHGEAESTDLVDEGDAADPAGEDESAELSDDEIEAVFKETMQRVKERQETESDE